jgi:hypothetical protein
LLKRQSGAGTIIGGLVFFGPVQTDLLSWTRVGLCRWQRWVWRQTQSGWSATRLPVRSLHPRPAGTANFFGLGCQCALFPRYHGHDRAGAEREGVGHLDITAFGLSDQHVAGGRVARRGAPRGGARSDNALVTPACSSPPSDALRRRVPARSPISSASLPGRWRPRADAKAHSALFRVVGLCLTAK